MDGIYYVGPTNDLSQRMHDPARGKGSSYTKGTKPVALIWFESHPPREAATAREKQLKAWNRAKKHAIATGKLHLGSSVRCVSV
jgi:putative endonuclease